MSQEKDIEELPIMKYRDEIVSKTRNNIVTLIFGGKTGCGKSTKIPQFIMDNIKKENCNILVTQPRKIAAMTIAKRVSVERNCKLGEEVGFQISLQKKVSANRQTKILFCTTGVLLEKIIYEKSISQYSHIILDEIHERNVDTDLLMNIVREFLLLGKCDTKLILMSATLNLKQFQDYFTLTINGRIYTPAIVTIEADMKYEIAISYLDELEKFRISDKVVNYSVPSISNELYNTSGLLIRELIKDNSKGILIFLPGIYEIESLHLILSKQEEIKGKCLIIVLHSSLPTDQQKEAFMRSTLPKVILSTNLAETSVTIPDVEHVIDFCLTKNLVCEESSLSALKLEFASKNSCIQRAGRTGRVCNGKVFRLIHQRYYTHLREENIPEMQRVPLENVILRVKILDIEAPVPFLSKCISRPEQNSITKSVIKLKELGGLKILNEDDKFISNDGILTNIGKIMANLPIDVQLSKLIILGYIFSVLDEIVIIAAGLNIRNVFKINYNNMMHDFYQKARWSNGTGCDAITILNAYKFWQDKREKDALSIFENEQKFCNQFGLDKKNLNEMRFLILKIQDRLKEMKIESLIGTKTIEWTTQEKILIIKICLAGAFIPNIFIRGKSDIETEKEVYKSLMGMDHHNTVYFRKMDRDQFGIVYSDRIKEKLIKYGIADKKNKIKVAFDSTKVFVQFNDQKSMIDDENYSEIQLRKELLFPGNICNEVYRAVKFRKTSTRNNMIIKGQQMNKNENASNSGFELEVLSSYETKAYAQIFNILEVVRDEYQVKKVLGIHPEHVNLPSYNTKELKGFVRHVEHCNKFFFHPADDGLLLDIEKWLKNEKLVPVKNLKSEKLAIAYHEKRYKRVKVLEIYDHHADCFFFDYGYTKKIKVADLFEIENEEIMEWYFLIYERSFECRLLEIAPSYQKCPRGKWTKEAIKVFSDQVLNNFCRIVIYSVVQEVVTVELFAPHSLNEFLVAQGYARKARESYASQLNNIERKNVQSSVTEWYSREEEFADKESNIVKISIPSPKLELCDKIIRLDGPYSPLETSIWDLSIKNRGMIQVDPHSVNSVVLDDEIENYNGTVLIAAETMKNANRGLTLYNISTMPKIFALPELLAMIFSPKVMFYTDKTKLRYTGIRFGLGYDENTYEAYNYDHDCYLPINYEKELLDDIRDINGLRLCMSCLLQRSCDSSEEDKFELMNSIKYYIIKILSKTRTPVENSPDIPDLTYRWKSDCYKDIQFANDIFKAGPFCSIQIPSLTN